MRLHTCRCTLYVYICTHIYVDVHIVLGCTCTMSMYGYLLLFVINCYSILLLLLSFLRLFLVGYLTKVFKCAHVAHDNIELEQTTLDKQNHQLINY